MDGGYSDEIESWHIDRTTKDGEADMIFPHRCTSYFISNFSTLLRVEEGLPDNVRHSFSGRPLRRMLLIATLGILTQSVGCGMNTTIDDSAYRPVGATQPVNVRAAQPQAASTKASKEHPEYTADGLDLNTNKRRFGFGLNIERIVRTAEIHCKPKHFPSAIEGQGLEACHYQFPRYCGAHSFTVLKAPNQAALIFHDKSSNRVIWDTFRDNHLAQPGLWDLADKLSVATPYPEQQIQAQLAEPDWRGWEVAMNLDDRKRFGAAYAAAINQVLACF